MQQKMAFFVMPPKSNNSVHLEDTKSSWIPITKEGNLLIIFTNFLQLKKETILISF